MSLDKLHNLSRSNSSLLNDLDQLLTDFMFCPVLLDYLNSNDTSNNKPLDPQNYKTILHFGTKCKQLLVQIQIWYELDEVCLEYNNLKQQIEEELENITDPIQNDYLITVAYKQLKYMKLLHFVKNLKQQQIDNLPTSIRLILHLKKSTYHQQATQLIKHQELKHQSTTVLNSSKYIIPTNTVFASLSMMRNITQLLGQIIQPYICPFLKNDSNIPFCTYQTVELLNYKTCTVVHKSLEEGDVSRCTTDDQTGFQVVIKCSQNRYEKNENMFHEAVIGRIINDMRDSTPCFAYTYLPFFCSPFNDDMLQLCNDPFHAEVIRTILVSEYCGRQTLDEFFHQPDVTYIERKSTLLMIAYTLLYAQSYCSFVHTDLHSSNIIMNDLGEYKDIQIQVKNEMQTISCRYVPQIIDFSKSVCKYQGTRVSPFHELFGNPSRIEKRIQRYCATFASYDWLRLLMSLSSNPDNFDILKFFIQPYRVKAKNAPTPFNEWCERLFLQPKLKMNIQDIPMLDEKDDYYCEMILDSMVQL